MVVQTSDGLADVGFTADHEADAVDKWLEEKYIGPDVEERTWGEFTTELCSRDGAIVLVKALLWDILHPDGWVRLLIAMCKYMSSSKRRAVSVLSALMPTAQACDMARLLDTSSERAAMQCQSGLQCDCEKHSCARCCRRAASGTYCS
jgi:hypothetical protein